MASIIEPPGARAPGGLYPSVSRCEGVALAEKGGVAREVAVDAMLKSVVASPVITYRAPLILEGHISDATYGSVNLQQKDVLLALGLRLVERRMFPTVR